MSVCIPEKKSGASLFSSVVSLRWLPVLRAPGIRSLCVVGLLAASFSVPSLIPSPELPPLITVGKSLFRVSVTSTGTVEPLQSVSVLSESEWPVQIISLVPEGTWVKKGDVVCVMDSSKIEDFERTYRVFLIQAEAALAASVQSQDIQQIGNERELAEAERTLKSAELELNEYSDGVYPNEVSRLSGDILISGDRLDSASDDMRFTERMWSMGYASRPQVEIETLRVNTQSEEVRRLQFEKGLLEEFTHPRKDMEMTQRLSESRLNVLRTELRGSLAAAQAKLAALSNEHRMTIFRRHVKSARDSIAACTMRASCDGQVFHCNNWQMQSHGVQLIEEGKMVYRSQPIFEIPDQHHLKVTLPLNESLITSVAVGKEVTIKPVGSDQTADAVISRISPYPVIRNRHTPDVREFLLEVMLTAVDVLNGDLRPRMEAEGTLTIVEKKDAITVPREAVIHYPGRSLVILKTRDELRVREVQPGEVSDGKVLIESGLQEGDQIVADITEDQLAGLRERFDSLLDAGD